MNIKSWRRMFFFLFLTVACQQSGISGEGQRLVPCENGKKIIAVGSSTLSPKELRENIETAEKYLPVDGIVIQLDVETETDGKKFMAFRHSVCGGVNWKREWLKPAVADLKATRFCQFTDNFLYISTFGYNSDFFDDQRWASICHNAAVIAEFARETGLKGVFFDIEYYGRGKTWPMFKFNPNGKKSFAECEKQARKRGRELMSAFAKAFPEIVIIADFGTYSANFYAAADHRHTKQHLQSYLYGLSSAFFDGMFEVIPPAARLYDGIEFQSYLAGDLNAYRKIAHDYLTLTPQVCDPALLGKIWNQSGLAVAMYMESYINEKGIYKVVSPVMDRVKLFRRNLHSALQTSSAYTWIYYDTAARWFPIKRHNRYERMLKNKPLWQEKLPGINEAIIAARDPLAYARKQLAAGRAELIRKVDFENGKLDIQIEYGGKNPKEKKIVELDTTMGASGKASVRYTGFVSGGFYFKSPAKPGNLYYVRAKAKNFRPETHLRMCFGSSAKIADRIVCFAEPDSNGWMQAEAVLFFPENAKELIVSCGIMSRIGSDCRFDDIELYLIP